MSEQNVVHVARDEYLDSVKALADDGYTMCVDLTGVDYLELAGRTVPDGVAAERFEEEHVVRPNLLARGVVEPYRLPFAAVDRIA